MGWEGFVKVVWRGVKYGALLGLLFSVVVGWSLTRITARPSISRLLERWPATGDLCHV
jgi:hypothetical protein